MDSRILSNRGFTIFELTTTLLIMVSIFLIVIPSYETRLKNAEYEKTIKELSAIAQASIDYFNLGGTWPAKISQLTPKFIPQAIISSPFGTNYQISTTNNLITVSILIPAGIAQKNSLGQLLVINNQGTQDQIEISKTIQNEFTSRLTYDLRHVN